MFLRNSEFMYKFQSLKTDATAEMKTIEFFQYFCEKTILKTHGPSKVSYGFDRAGKTTHDTLKKIFKKYAHSVQPCRPWSRRAF